MVEPQHFTIYFLKTQETRETLIRKLQAQLEIAEKEAENAEDSTLRAEWTRIVAFLSQTLNGLLKAYDIACFNEDVQQVKHLLERAKREHQRLREWQEQLEAREKALALREHELATR